MKVELLETGGWGGICHYSYNLAQALSGAGLEVSLLTGVDFELEDRPRDFRLHKIIDPCGGYPKNIFKIIGRYREEKPEVFHAQSLLSPRKDWLLFAAARALKIPTVATAHNVLPHDAEERDALGLRLGLKLIYRACAAVIAHSNRNKDSLCAEFGLAGEKVSVIPHGNYLFALPPKLPGKKEARAALGLAPDGKVVLCFGAIRRYKGIEFLVKAFERAEKALPQARLLIAGDLAEDYRRDYRSAIEAGPASGKIVSIEKYVSFAEMGLYFCAADVVVFPYLEIGQSGSMQLAFAFSKPVVATCAGSFPETVEEGSNGFLVPPRDAGALAGALVKILTKSEAEIEKMGEMSYFLARTRHDWAAVAAAHSDLYRSLLPAE